MAKSETGSKVALLVREGKDCLGDRTVSLDPVVINAEGKVRNPSYQGHGELSGLEIECTVGRTIAWRWGYSLRMIENSREALQIAQVLRKLEGRFAKLSPEERPHTFGGFCVEAAVCLGVKTILFSNSRGGSYDDMEFRHLPLSDASGAINELVNAAAGREVRDGAEGVLGAF